MRAIVDCNSFYCSCERVFRPELLQRPVVVLSNNDGCIISISDEAKALGISMAEPYFKSKKFIEENGIETFSSNYNLYGDLSWRVMETLRILLGKENVEVYSVDEAFLDFKKFEKQDLESIALDIKQTVEKWTGIAVSIGVAPTKVLCKVANRLAKKDKKKSKCIMVIDTAEKINEALCKTKVKDLWGIGRKYAEKLVAFGIEDAYQLSNMPEEWVRKNLGGVVGVRMLKELKGIAVIDMEEQLTNKKMIASTRMFGSAVSELKDVKEAIATYTVKAAEKLRRQKSAASSIAVFVVRKEERKPGDSFSHGETISALHVLPQPSALTQQLIKAAMKMVEDVYKSGNQYKKAGVILSGLVEDTSLQGNLFIPPSKNNNSMLMNVIDNINFSMRNDTLKFAASGIERNWKMRQELRSPRYTSRWDELCEVK